MIRTSIYSPALRFKEGEYKGLGVLSADVADHVRPRFILPPPKEKDREEKRLLSQNDVVHLTGARIGKYWANRRSYVDPRFLFKEYGDDPAAEWLPKLFAHARSSGGLPTPVATISDLTGRRLTSLRASVDPSKEVALAMRIRSGEIDRDLRNRLAEAVASSGFGPGRCDLILDFDDADLSSADTATGVLVGAVEDVLALGNWRDVIFQGTNYPIKNPAGPGETHRVSRNEWLMWRDARAISREVESRLLYGDYAADNAKINFDSSGGVPHRQYRYCTSSDWLLVRAPDGLSASQAMRVVCQRIVGSGSFAGRDFSHADEVIYSTATGGHGPGNPTIWREINTAHHITQVVADLGGIFEYSITRRAAEPEQLAMFGG